MQIVAEFRVKDRADVDGNLDAAVVAALSDSSVEGTCGVLVTRHDFGHFSVALSPDVPAGLIQEHDFARRN
jgi:hypothetical protein